LVAAIDRPDLAADQRFTDAATRMVNSEPLVAALDEAFARMSMDELIRRFDAHDVWWAPVNSIADVIADPQTEAAGAFVDMTPRPGEAPYRAVNGPLDFDGRRLRPGPVPELGEHTAEVLGELDR
jgi:crotonobetainyl-CoA:carnitine CoA-transferase CaiB-like acyl-CoA transferase